MHPCWDLNDIWCPRYHNDEKEVNSDRGCSISFIDSKFQKRGTKQIRQRQLLVRNFRNLIKSYSYRLRKIFKQFWKSITEDGGIPIAIVGSFVSKLTLVACSMFGTLLVSDNFKKSGEPNYEEKAKDLLSIIFLINNCISVPACLIFGYLGDKMKVWKSLAVNLFIGCTSGFIFIYFANENGMGLTVSFVSFLLFAQIIQMQVSRYFNLTFFTESNHVKQARKA